MTRLLAVCAFCVCAALGAHAQSRSVSILDFGAVGNGTSLNTGAIQHAIDSVARSGGGTVRVPAGVFVTGTLQLRSNIELHLEHASVLRGSVALEDYMLDSQRVGLLFTQDAVNVSITGSGTIDGRGDEFMDLTRAKGIEHAGVALTRQKEMFRHVDGGIGDGPVVPRERPYQMVIFSRCRDVTVRGITLTDAPFWTLHLADCEGVIVSGLRIRGNLLVPNNDGIDVTSCRNVTIADCDISTGDDCIAITGYSRHFELPGYSNLMHPCENVAVSNCHLVSRSAAIRIGGFDQNPMRNFTFTNITITSSNRGIGIFGRDEGGIENLLFSNMVIETRLHTGDWWGNAEPIHLSAVRLAKDVRLGRVRNIVFQNILCRGESGILVYGSRENRIEEVTFDNVSLHLEAGRLTAASGGNIDLRPALDPAEQLFAHDIPAVYAQHVRGVRFSGVTVTWGDVQEPFFTHGLEVGEFEEVMIDNFRGTAAPHNATASAIRAWNGRGLQVSGNVQNVSTQNVQP